LRKITFNAVKRGKKGTNKEIAELVSADVQEGIQFVSGQ
jgi:hypothetical protein